MKKLNPKKKIYDFEEEETDESERERRTLEETASEGQRDNEEME